MDLPVGETGARLDRAGPAGIEAVFKNLKYFLQKKIFRCSSYELKAVRNIDFRNADMFFVNMASVVGDRFKF